MRPVARNPVLGLTFASLLAGCGDDSGGGPTSTSPASGIATLPTGDPSGPDTGDTGVGTDADPTSGSGPTGDPSGPTSDSSDPKFDLGVTPDGGMVDTGEIDCNAMPNHPDCMCTIPDHTPCDNGTQDPFLAMGLNCPGELQVQASKTGDPGAIGVRSTFGQTGTFNAREGSQYAVIGSGLVSELNTTTPQNDSNAGPTFCNDALGGSPDPGPQLPAPIKINPVGGDCTQNQALVGTGDCSGTINGQYSQGGNAFDYTELRFTLQVPPDVVAFSYDFAFFSTEYPYYYGSQFNDMYVGWLESEKWTGNISFDQQGNPISLNAGFLEFRDDGGNAPVFGSTCMRQHAGTNWLTTKAGVTPGESITVVFAVFDLADPILDSYAFIDNFQWSCEPTGKPSTMPPA
jgi:hypothetical protein